MTLVHTNLGDPKLRRMVTLYCEACAVGIDVPVDLLADAELSCPRTDYHRHTEHALSEDHPEDRKRR